MSEEKDKKLSWLDTLKSVLMSCLGVQTDEMRERDFSRGHPARFIIMGLMVAVTLVVTIILLVKIIIYTSGV